MAKKSQSEELIQKLESLRSSRQAWLDAGETKAVESLDKRIEEIRTQLNEESQGIIDRTEQMIAIDTKGMFKSFRERMNKLEAKAPKSKFKPSKGDATTRIADALEEFLHFERRAPQP